MKVIIINGPNLNLLGKREPSIYGDISFEEYFVSLKDLFPKIDLTYYQSNIEGHLINKLHEKSLISDLIIINAGGYTHTSVAISDAISAISCPCIEVHISQPTAREEFRHKSLISSVCKSTISGFGMDSYRLALLSLSTPEK